MFDIRDISICLTLESCCVIVFVCLKYSDRTLSSEILSCFRSHVTEPLSLILIDVVSVPSIERHTFSFLILWLYLFGISNLVNDMSGHVLALEAL